MRREEELKEVVVMTPRRRLYQGRGRSVSSRNGRGDFDILPGHARFISLIEKEVAVVDGAGRRRRFAVGGRGVVWAVGGRVWVLIKS